VRKDWHDAGEAFMDKICEKTRRHGEDLGEDEHVGN
jgi:hypothetical protein